MRVQISGGQAWLRSACGLAAFALVGGCGHGASALDAHGRLACTYGYLGGLGQLQHNVVAEDRGLVDAFHAAQTSGASVLKAWVSANSVVGSSARKPQDVADTSLLHLLQVCRGLGWRAATATPTPAASP